VVVCDGLAVALDAVDEDNTIVGDQLYETPLTGASPIDAPFGFNTHVLVKSAPALAIGGVVLTVTVT